MITETCAIVDDIIKPIDEELLISDLQYARYLGNTKDNIGVFISSADETSNILTEISRLREITFRLVGEGTGKSSDRDIFDNYYKHLFLWDFNNLTIVGSYRIGFLQELLSTYGKESIYTNTLCHFNEELIPTLNQSLELGRSFIQKKYWKSNALDYLWQGIAKIVNENSNVKYLWGPVSISNSYPEEIKKMIVYYYKKWYQFNSDFIKTNNPFILSVEDTNYLKEIFNQDDLYSDYISLKKRLNSFSLSVPVLIRKYTNLTEYQGSYILGFNIDRDFSDCIDALILVDLSKLKEIYKFRYYNQKSFIKS